MLVTFARESPVLSLSLLYDHLEERNRGRERLKQTDRQIDRQTETG